MKVFRIKILIGLFFVLLTNDIFSQEFITEDEATGNTDKPSFWDNVYFGGDLGMSFGSYTYVNIAPEAGYIITDRLSAGVGIIYQYYNLNSVVNPYKTSVYGGKVFARFFVFDNVFLYSVTEIVSLETRYFDYTGQFEKQNRFLMASPLVGAGYFQRFSDKGGVGLMLLFNLNQSRNSPYYNYPMPIIRLGFGF